MIGTEIKEFGLVAEQEELMVVHVDLPPSKNVRLHDHETHTLTPGTLLRFPGEAMIGIEAIVDSEFYVYLINRRN